ncbi:MAG: NUDIX hydrolase [Patescibacteria group bacterium]|nr:NUDIX hydrolase [Patescibacteria group bacterium]
MTKIIIVSGPVIVENGQVLLNKHGDTTFWKFCGGQVEDFDLDLEEAAAREVKEEMGIGIKVIDHEPFITHAVKETPAGKLDVILVHYLAERIGEIKPGADIQKWEWIPLEDLKEEELGPNVIPALRHFGFWE